MTIGDGPLTFILMLKLLSVVGGCTLDFSVSSGPFLSYEIEIGDGPGPELDKNDKASINNDTYNALVRVKRIPT